MLLLDVICFESGGSTLVSAESPSIDMRSWTVGCGLDSNEYLTSVEAGVRSPSL